MRSFSEYLEAVQNESPQLDQEYYGNEYGKNYGANKSIEEELKEIQEKLKTANSATMKLLLDRKAVLELELQIQKLNKELQEFPMNSHIEDDVYREKLQSRIDLQDKLEKLKKLKGLK